MKYTSHSNFYSLVLNDNWTIEEYENIITIYDPTDGFGAINISSYQIPENYFFKAQDELADFISGDINICNTEEIIVTNVNDLNIASFEQIVEKRYWLYYVFYRKHKAVFITYNCDSNHKTYEKTSVHSIIKSLQIN